MYRLEQAIVIKALIYALQKPKILKAAFFFSAKKTISNLFLPY